MSHIVKDLALPSGVRLQYVEQGDPNGVPVLFLHGYSDCWTSYARNLEHLPESIRAVSLTQRGHGDADRPAGDYSIAQLAADAADAIDALELGPAVVVGSSMGSWVAQRVAIDYPDKVLGAVLSASFSTPRDNDAMQALQAEVAALSDPIDRSFAHEFQVSTVERGIPDDVMSGYVDESMKLPAWVWKAVAEGFADVDHSEGLARLEMPVVLIWGDRDVFVQRSDQDRLAEWIPNVERIEYAGTGHAVHWDEPERFAQDVARFVYDVVSSDRTPRQKGRPLSRA